MANTVKAGHAIDGFEFSLSTGDVVVSDGAIDGSAIAGVTLDVSTLALGDGENKVIYNGSAVTAVAAATALGAAHIQLGTFTEATGAATAVNAHNGRGNTALVTTDDTVSL